VDPRSRILFALAFIAVVVLAGAAALLLGDSVAPDPDAPPNAASVVGVIVGVEAQGLTDVRGFTLRDLENGTEFPPGHLVEHQATAEQVRVWYRDEGDRKVAIRLEDAT